MVLADPCDDQEMITDEEKSVFVGSRCKSFKSKVTNDVKFNKYYKSF